MRDSKGSLSCAISPAPLFPRGLQSQALDQQVYEQAHFQWQVPACRGVGMVGVVIVGTVALGEHASLPRLACLALVITGVSGLALLEGTA